MVVLILFVARTRVQAADVSSDEFRWAIGINYLGGQIDCRFNPNWIGELRYVTGSTKTDDGTIKASVLGLRGYRLYRKDKNIRPYLGAETGYVSSNSFGYKTSGFDLGGFGGIEYGLGRRVFLGLDIGPYLFSLKEKNTHVSDSGLEFVANAAIIVYLF